MAIVWGPVSGNFRLGIDAVVSGTTATIIVYGQSVGFGHNWTETLNLSGAWSGQKAVSFYSGFGQTVTTEFYRASYSYTGSRTFSASISYWSGTATVSRTVTVANPKPNAPTNLTVSRSSDQAIELSWSRTSTYSAVVVQRETWVRTSMGYGPWVQVGRPSGNAFAFTDTTLGAGQAAKYRVAGVGSGGQSAWSNISETVRTTPAPPVGVSAQRDGSTVLVSWAWGADQLSDGAEVYRNGILVGTVGTGFGGGAPTTWVDTQLPAGVFSYTVRAFAKTIGSSGASLYSEPSHPSNQISTLAPPAAPSALSPNGGTVPSGEPTSLTWSHNPVDTSPQSAGEVRVRVNGGGWSTITVGAVSSAEYTPPAGTVEWQVRTRGLHPDWSPWSSVAQFTVIDRPGVGVLAPEDGGVWDTPMVTVSWSYLQAQGRPQSAWRATLFGPAGVIEQRSGSGPTGQVTFQTRVDHDLDYRVVVAAAAGDVWSFDAPADFHVFFVPPAPPFLEAYWDDMDGGHYVTVTAGENGPGGTPATMLAENGRVLVDSGAWPTHPTGISRDGDNLAFDTTGQADDLVAFATPDGRVLVDTVGQVAPQTVSISLERSTDGGVTWVPINTNLPPGQVNTLADWEGLSAGETQYRATSYAESGASTITLVTVLSDSKALWVSPGPSYSDPARLPYDLKISVTSGRERSTEYYEGREFPVSYAGQQLARSVSASGSLVDGQAGCASRADLDRIGFAASPTHLVRTPAGHRVYGSLSDVQKTLKRGGLWDWSLTLTETEE